MDKFVVSARKYRPVTFDSVVGQSHITTTLKNAIKEEQLAQAFLFCGPRGVGKTTNARILAKTINCTNKTKETEACGECNSCKAFNQNASFNIHELDAASNNTVDDIRNLVDQVRFPPQAGKYKVYIIDEVHMLSNQAFNAFLKTLEEPPEYAIFILATTEKHKIIPTILSRCQIFDFKRIKVNDMATHLKGIATKEEIKVDDNSLHLIAQKADGGLRDALSMFDLLTAYTGKNILYQDVTETLHILDYDYYFDFTNAFSEEDMGKALLLFNKVVEKGFDIHNFISGLGEHFRDLLVCQEKATIELLDLSDDLKKRYQKQASESSKSFLLSALSILNHCELNFKQAKNQRLHTELCLIKLCNLKAALNFSLENAVSTDDSVKKKAKPESIESTPEAQVERGIATPSFKEKHKTAKQAILSSTSKKTEKTVKIPKISDLKLGGLKSKTTNSTTEVQAPEAPYIQQEQNEPFNEGDLKIAWNSFTDSLTNRSWQSVLKQEYSLSDDYTITLLLTNKIELDFLESFRSDLTIHLKKSLKNTNLRVEAKVRKSTEQVNKPYTPMEKFHYMQQKNPALADLAKRLNLDVNF